MEFLLLFPFLLLLVALLFPQVSRSEPFLPCGVLLRLRGESDHACVHGFALGSADEGCCEGSGGGAGGEISNLIRALVPDSFVVYVSNLLFLAR